MGQICWVPVTYLDKIPRILDVKRADPSEHYATSFEIRNMSDQDFKKKNRLPIKALKLRETEELIIARAKRRQAIIVATGSNTIFGDPGKGVSKDHHEEDNILVVPLYGVEYEEHKGGYPSKMVARVKAMYYRQLFYCPSHTSPFVCESVARIDRIRTIFPIYPLFEPEAIALSDEALGVLMAMLREYFGSEDEGDLEAVRELAMETLPEEAVPRN